MLKLVKSQEPKGIEESKIWKVREEKKKKTF